MKFKKSTRFLLSLCLMTLTFLCGGNKAWAADVTVTSTFTDKNWSVGTDEPLWTSSGATTEKLDATRGVQITLTKIKTSGLKLSNSSIKDLGNIKSITLTVSANGAGGKISNVKVGSTSFLNNGNSSYTVVKENNQTVTFETNTPIAGDIVISFSSTADSKSLYIKSISVTYQEASTPTLEYTVSWKVNGADYTEGTPTTKVKSGSAVTTLPTAPSDIAGKTFVGWTDAAIATPSASAPSPLFTKTANAPAVTGNVTYYAVFASASETGETSEELTQTLEYDTWTYGGSTTNKDSYRLLHTNGYIESTEFDLSTLSKVIVYGGTFGGKTYNKLNIGNGTTTWKDVTVSGSSNTGVNTYTDGTPLSGKGTLKIASMSGSNSGTGSGIRVSKIEIYTLKSNIAYSDYVTTVSDKLPAQL